MRLFVCGAAVATCFFACTSSKDDGSPGYVDDIEVLSVSDAYGGASFGSVGPYEVVTAIVHGKLDPRHPANARIVDVALAPTDSEGMVAYSTDAVILRPKNASTANHVLFYDVANRGSKLGLSAMDAAGGTFEEGQQGNGFLLNRGYTIVWSGWQSDLPQSGRGGPMGTSFPVAKNTDGTSITGMSREEFVLDNTTDPVTLTLTYPAATRDASQVTFNVRASWVTAAGMTWDSPSQPIDPSSWQYVDDTHVLLHRPSGVDAGAIYSFVYPSKDPVVAGIGFAAVRDLVTFLRHDAVDAQGHANPVADITYDVAMGEGISQSGRFLRDFLWQGFNDDARGHKVFDGVLPIIAGSRKTFINFRWGQPGRWSKEHEDHFQPGDQFPFAYPVTTDPIGGKTDGILGACSKSGTCPKVIHLDGSFEFWGARASLNVTDGAGHDMAMPDDVRLYLSTATQHGGGGGVGTQGRAVQCQHLTNPVHQNSVDRAMVALMEDWLVRGTPPPRSNYPSVAEGTLVLPTSREQVRFPDLSGVGVNFTGIHNRLYVTDYSSAVPGANLSKPYEVRVPPTDLDGNDIPGIRVPDVSVPLASYLPWNIRKTGYSPGEMCVANGSTIPFLATAADRQQAHDPRLSLAERYTGKADYVNKVRAAAESLVSERFLLPADVDFFVTKAQSVTAF